MIKLKIKSAKNKEKILFIGGIQKTKIVNKHWRVKYILSMAYTRIDQ